MHKKRPRTLYVLPQVVILTKVVSKNIIQPKEVLLKVLESHAKKCQLDHHGPEISKSSTQISSAAGGFLIDLAPQRIGFETCLVSEQETYVKLSKS